MNSDNILNTGISFRLLSAINYIKNYNIPKPIIISKKSAEIKINEHFFDYIFDVRNKTENDNYKIKDSINFYLPTINKKTLQNYNVNKKYLLYCNNGLRAKKGAQILKANNFKNVYYLK